MPKRSEILHTVFEEDFIQELGGESLYLMNEKLLIQEGKEFIFWREAPDFQCPYCFKPVEVQCILVPGDIYDIRPWKDDIEKMKQRRGFSLSEFSRLEEIPFGSIWYYVQEFFGQIEKQCECNWSNY